MPAPELEPVPYFLVARRSSLNPLVDALRDVAVTVTARLIGLVPGAHPAP